MNKWYEIHALKPCPFCGGEAQLNLRRATWRVSCKGCGAFGKSVEIGDPINSFPFYTVLGGADEAIELWNRRDCPA